MEIYRNVNREKLSQELNDVGIRCYVFALDNNSSTGAKIKFVEGTDMKLVQQIIDTHDPTPLPTQPTAEERISELENIIITLLMEVG